MATRVDSKLTTPRRLRSAIWVIAAWAIAAPLVAQTDETPVSCGRYRTLHSTVLGEDRAVIVGLPADYERSGRSYPVLYRLDGELVTFLHTLSATAFLVDMREHDSDYIVVAVRNTDRGRDMDPEAGADNFIRFLKSELVPFIEKNYRAAGRRVVAGQSFSALFSVYSLLKEPGLFDTYLLGSFALYKPELTSVFGEALNKAPLGTVGRRFVFVANGKLDPYDPDGSRTRRGADFLELLSRSGSGTVTVGTVLYEDEGHVPFGFVYDGLKWLDSHASAVAR